jgi:hypothetical protein
MVATFRLLAILRNPCPLLLRPETMKRKWNTEELAEHWTLQPNEAALLAQKGERTRLGFAMRLKFFQFEHRFPQQNGKRFLPP